VKALGLLAMAVAVIAVCASVWYIAAKAKGWRLSSQREKWEIAESNARWRHFQDCRDGLMHVGIRRVAQVGRRTRVVGEEVLISGYPAPRDDLADDVALVEAQGWARRLNTDS
jgi:hypothetical protein